MGGVEPQVGGERSNFKEVPYSRLSQKQSQREGRAEANAQVLRFGGNACLLFAVYAGAPPDDRDRSKHGTP